jgi:hypothetical protein
MTIEVPTGFILEVPYQQQDIPGSFRAPSVEDSLSLSLSQVGEEEVGKPKGPIPETEKEPSSRRSIVLNL